MFSWLTLRLEQSAGEGRRDGAMPGLKANTPLEIQKC